MSNFQVTPTTNLSITDFKGIRTTDMMINDAPFHRDSRADIIDYTRA